MKHTLLLAVGIGLIATAAGAGVTITNNTRYELIAWVKYDLGSMDLPGKSLGKDGQPVPGAVGIQPGESNHRTKDGANVKREWKAWVKKGGAWIQVLDRKWSRGGAFVHAKIMERPDPVTGEKIYVIEVGGN